jgi:phosphatidylserine/phosphatidylglycerophosphate/cardiolipin synthase-like enzyme
MHHKFAVFDKAKALTGSYNWTRSAATSNRENILVTDDPRAVEGFGREFERLWKAFA